VLFRSREPNTGLAYVGLATALRGSGDQRGALAALERGLPHAGGDVALLNSLARTLATSPDDAVRDGRRAVDVALQAINAAGARHIDLLDTLAAAYAERGNFASARETIISAIGVARDRGDEGAVSVLESRLVRYRASQPLRENAFLPVGASGR